MSPILTPIPASPGLLCTRDQVKARIQITFSGSDTLIDDLIATVLPTVTNRYGCEFMPQTNGETRTFDVRHRLVDLTGCDLRTATSVVLDPNGTPNTLTAGSDYILLPCRLTGTYPQMRISDALGIDSAFSRGFGAAQLAVTGDWGIWGTTADVPADIQEAAIECVLSWMDKPVSDIGAIDSSTVRQQMPGVAQSWDIPASAHRKFSPYNRNLGVI
jgi:hypothetical protein